MLAWSSPAGEEGHKDCLSPLSSQPKGSRPPVGFSPSLLQPLLLFPVFSCPELLPAATTWSPCNKAGCTPQHSCL